MAGEVSVWARRRSRRLLVQAIYEWQLSGNDYATVRGAFSDRDDFRKADADYFDVILGAVMRRSEELDGHFSEYLDRAVASLDPVERGILRMATFELLERIEVPWLAIINEATQLAKVFGAQDSYKYVNGVLDRVGRKLRPVEAEHAARQRSAPQRDDAASDDA